MSDAAPMDFDDPVQPPPPPKPPARRTIQTAAPDRSPPHSAEAEEHVIACCLLDGEETIERCRSHRISAESFYFPANRLLFEVITDLHTSGKAVMLETLAEELKTRRQLEAIGGFAYLMQVTGKIPTTAHAGYFIEAVAEKHARRELIKSATGIVEQAYAGTSIDELQSQASKLADVTIRSQSTSEILKARRVKAANPPAEPVCRLFLADKPIATPGNITTLISRAKTGKTATLGAATAAIITASTQTQALKPDNLGFTASNPKGNAVIVIDTEQSPFDAYTCYKRSLERTGNSEDPKWLYHYSLVGMSPEQLKQALDGAIRSALKECKGIFAIILDGCADFVNSVNDEEECNTFVNWLRERTVDHDCPAICVIHSNEGVKTGDDGRGHLGKQLTRKAESNLLLKKEGEVTTITSEKQRKAPITTKDGIAFKWSDELGRHVSCESSEVDERSKGRSVKYTFDTFARIFPKKSEKPKTRQALYRFAAELDSISESAFRDVLARAVESGELERIPDGGGYSYRLTL